MKMQYSTTDPSTQKNNRGIQTYYSMRFAGGSDDEIRKFLKSGGYPNVELIIQEGQARYDEWKTRKVKRIAIKGESGNGKAHQPDQFEQKRLKLSYDSEIYQVKDERGNVIAKIQIYNGVDQSLKVAELEATIADLRAELDKAYQFKKMLKEAIS